jgi:hypothetical protein
MNTGFPVSKPIPYLKMLVEPRNSGCFREIPGIWHLCLWNLVDKCRGVVVEGVAAYHWLQALYTRGYTYRT